VQAAKDKLLFYALKRLKNRRAGGNGRLYGGGETFPFSKAHG